MRFPILIRALTRRNSCPRCDQSNTISYNSIFCSPATFLIKYAIRFIYFSYTSQNSKRDSKSRYNCRERNLRTKNGAATYNSGQFQRQRIIDETQRRVERGKERKREREKAMYERSRVNRLQSIRGSSWSRNESGEG